MYPLSLLKEVLSHAGKALLQHDKDSSFANFRTEVLQTKNKSLSIAYTCYKDLLRNTDYVISDTFGAGSRKQLDKKTIGKVAQLTSVNPKRGKILSNLVKYFKPELIIELGTSLGISTMYMAEGHPGSKIITVEANTQLAVLAAENFQRYGFENIRIINRYFDEVLKDLSEEINSDTLVFIDGNHSYESTLRYSEALRNARVMVLDDIRWSEGMIKAWNEINSHEPEKWIIDLLVMGIIIKKSNGKKFHTWL